MKNISEEKTESGDDNNKVSDEIGKKVSTRLSYENLTGEIKNTPIIETDGEFERENHAK